eukprot:755189-Hanusia_phi.AAC.1
MRSSSGSACSSRFRQPPVLFRVSRPGDRATAIFQRLTPEALKRMLPLRTLAFVVQEPLEPATASAVCATGLHSQKVRCSACCPTPVENVVQTKSTTGKGLGSHGLAPSPVTRAGLKPGHQGAQKCPDTSDPPESEELQDASGLPAAAACAPADRARSKGNEKDSFRAVREQEAACLVVYDLDTREINLLTNPQ